MFGTENLQVFEAFAFSQQFPLPLQMWSAVEASANYQGALEKETQYRANAANFEFNESDGRRDQEAKYKIVPRIVQKLKINLFE